MEARILIGALRRFFWLVIALIVVGAVAGGLLARSKSDKYQATSSLSVAQPNLSGIINSQAQLDPTQYIATQVAVLQSNSVLGPVAAQAKLSVASVESAVSASQQQGSDVVDVTATRPTAVAAADLSNLVTDTYITQQKQAIQNSINSAAANIRSLIKDLQAGVPSPAASTQISSYQSDLSQLSLVPAVPLNTQILNTATPPLSPVPKHVALTALIGVAAGLVIGVVIAVILAATRPRMLRRSDVEDAIGVAAAAELPFVTSWNQDGDGSAQVRWAHHDLFDDEMTKVAVFVEAARSFRNCKTVLVTSLEKGSGVSTVARELAATLQSGNRVVKSVPLPSLQADDFEPDDSFAAPRGIAAGSGTGTGASWGGFAVPQRVAESLGPPHAARAFIRPSRPQFRDNEYDADILVVDGGSLADSASVVPLARTLDVTVLVVPLPNENERYLNAVIRATFTDARGQLLVVTNNNLGPRSRRAAARE